VLTTGGLNQEFDANKALSIGIPKNDESASYDMISGPRANVPIPCSAQTSPFAESPSRGKCLFLDQGEDI